MIRHTPGNNQRALALFLARGHYERLAARYRASLREKAQQISEAVRRYLPTWQFREPTGGSALWVQGQSGANMDSLEPEARKKGILIESGSNFFYSAEPSREFARLAYSTIDLKQIEPGIRLLAQVAWEQRNNNRQLGSQQSIA
jgi:GntR family transcriptional regulator/MocR family aminotransferase